MTEKVMFCPCGRVLGKKINARYDGKVPGYCNKECKDMDDQKKVRGPKQEKKHGATGCIYD